MTITSSLRFLNIFDRSGPLCATLLLLACFLLLAVQCASLFLCQIEDRGPLFYPPVVRNYRSIRPVLMQDQACPCSSQVLFYHT